MKQRFTETSEVIVTREYDIPDEDILEVFESIEEFTTILKDLEHEVIDIEDIDEDKKEFIWNLSCDYEADDVGEPYWHGSIKGNVEVQWKFDK